MNDTRAFPRVVLGSLKFKKKKVMMSALCHQLFARFCIIPDFDHSSSAFIWFHFFSEK